MSIIVPHHKYKKYLNKMRVGSLVKYISDLFYINMHTPDRDEIYTVREVCPSISPQRPKIHLGIRLEEIVNEKAPDNIEYTYVAEHFVEVQPPMDDMLQELLSFTPEIENNVKR
jgi:hypothetical protein